MLADIGELGGKGGLIAVAPDGEAAWGFTTPGNVSRRSPMRAAATVAIYAETEPSGRAGRGAAIRSPASIAARSRVDEIGDRIAKARIGNEMGRAGDHRLIAARDLMLALRPGLDRVEAMGDRPFDRAVIAELEMEERHFLERSPNSGRKACPAR